MYSVCFSYQAVAPHADTYYRYTNVLQCVNKEAMSGCEMKVNKAWPPQHHLYNLEVAQLGGSPRIACPKAKRDLLFSN